MDKTSKILQILNLLSNRGCLTIKKIMETCNVSRRTVFRYLNAIADADIPLYFDEKTHAYRFVRSAQLRVDDLSIGNAVTILVALKLLSRSVNEEYRDDIEELFTKTLAKQPLPIEEALRNIKQYPDFRSGGADLSELVSLVLIQIAISCRRKVRLTTGNNSSGQSQIEIVRPSLHFRKNWELLDNQNLEQSPEPMAGIKKVTIL